MKSMKKDGICCDCKNDKEEYQTDPLLKEMLRAAVEPYGKPAIINLPAGHSYLQLTFPLGAAVMDADRGILSLKVNFLQKINRI